ncbi:UDP-glycosyltransferase 73C1-like [Carica papaya]|uniref:UDP-glycosyltransferase 73C1-like n=1 Tax=Carica papaya TaxID=3649 RepID=UPI000B8CF770|nr:UDP-glycosyltransferase 73C1-like [Carica papaya]
MDTQNHNQKFHFVLFPFMAQGHMIPMIDLARLLAQLGATITIVTTPLNASRFEPVISRALQSCLRINLVQLPFPCAQAGLAEGLENLDMLDSINLYPNFFRAVDLLEEPVQELFEKLTPPPCCVISDFLIGYTSDIAAKFRVPRIVFRPVSCFYLMCMHDFLTSKFHETVKSESEYFVLTNLPDKVKLTKAQIPLYKDEDFMETLKNIGAKAAAAYGEIINTFEELEPEYIREYRKARGEKIWCVGPLSLCNKNELDKAERGKKSTVDQHQWLTWLDAQESSSVIYACLGSLSTVPPEQVMELGLGLEASNRPFIWVIRDWNRSDELEKLISENEFEERIKGRGVLINGWAPQVVILSHPAIAGFLTHCGWNSTIEGISAGVPLITWPLFSDQFCNSELVVQLLKIGIWVGAEKALVMGEEEKYGLCVKKEKIKDVIAKLMDRGEEGERRRKRDKALAEMAKRGVEEGGSSHHNIIMFIQDIMQQQASCRPRNSR